MLDLSKLTEFNHALVYGFEPESSPQRLAGSETFEDILFPEAGQHQDMLNAYFYAQEAILPQIKKIGRDKITPNLLIQWVKTIHAFIGKSLMQVYGIKSGEYANEMAFRWHLGAQISAPITLYLSGLDETCKSPQGLAKILNEEFGMNHQSALDFISLLEKIDKDEQYTIHASLKPFINYKSPVIKAMVMYNKLASAYNLNQLSAEDKSIVNKIVKICMFPYLISEAMKQWAQTTVPLLHTCDLTDLKKVSEFLAATFFKLTAIHPFPNGNGRTATCLINTFLRAFDYPSIVLRYPGERGNKNGLYEKAFAEVDFSLLLFTELIQTRVVEAQKKAFTDEKLKKLIVLRVFLSDLLQETKSKHPNFDISAFQKQIFSAPEILFAMRAGDSTDASIAVLSIAINTLQQAAKKLEEAKEKKLTSFAAVTLESKQINCILASLEKISGQDGWKYNARQGLVIWVELTNRKKAEEIVSKLESIKAAKVTLTQRTDNKMPVIKCEQIDPQKLISAALPVNDKTLSTNQNRCSRNDR